MKIPYFTSYTEAAKCNVTLLLHCIIHIYCSTLLEYEIPLVLTLHWIASRCCLWEERCTDTLINTQVSGEIRLCVLGHHL